MKRQRKFSDYKITENISSLLYRGFPYFEDPINRKERIALRISQRQFVEQLKSLISFHAVIKRKLLKRFHLRGWDKYGELTDGYLKISIKTGAEQLMNRCEHFVEIYHSVLSRGKDALIGLGIDPESYLKEMEKTKHDPLKHVPFFFDPDGAKEIFKFFTRKDIIYPVAKYLGTLPVLVSVRILFSPNNSEALSNAQLFHRDPEGSRQVKVFLNLRDVEIDTGPFTFIPRSLSTKLTGIDEGFLGKRVGDDLVYKHVKEADLVTNIGPKGDCLFVDTSNCFHFGSRNGKGPRYLVYAQYQHPFSSVFRLVNPYSNIRDRFSYFRYPGEEDFVGPLLGREN